MGSRAFRVSVMSLAAAWTLAVLAVARLSLPLLEEDTCMARLCDSPNLHRPGAACPGASHIMFVVLRGLEPGKLFSLAPVRNRMIPVVNRNDQEARSGRAKSSDLGMYRGVFRGPGEAREFLSVFSLGYSLRGLHRLPVALELARCNEPMPSFLTGGGGPGPSSGLSQNDRRSVTICGEPFVQRLFRKTVAFREYLNGWKGQDEAAVDSALGRLEDWRASRRSLAMYFLGGKPAGVSGALRTDTAERLLDAYMSEVERNSGIVFVISAHLGGRMDSKRLHEFFAYGKGIRNEAVLPDAELSLPDLTATLCRLLHVPQPAVCLGMPVSDLFTGDYGARRLMLVLQVDQENHRQLPILLARRFRWSRPLVHVSPARVRITASGRKAELTAMGIERARRSGMEKRIADLAARAGLADPDLPGAGLTGPFLELFVPMAFLCSLFVLTAGLLLAPSPRHAVAFTVACCVFPHAAGSLIFSGAADAWSILDRPGPLSSSPAFVLAFFLLVVAWCLLGIFFRWNGTSSLSAFYTCGCAALTWPMLYYLWKFGPTPSQLPPFRFWLGHVSVETAVLSAPVFFVAGSLFTMLAGAGKKVSTGAVSGGSVAGTGSVIIVLLPVFCLCTCCPSSAPAGARRPAMSLVDDEGDDLKLMSMKVGVNGSGPVWMVRYDCRWMNVKDFPVRGSFVMNLPPGHGDLSFRVEPGPALSRYSAWNEFRADLPECDRGEGYHVVLSFGFVAPLDYRERRAAIVPLAGLGPIDSFSAAVHCSTLPGRRIRLPVSWSALLEERHGDGAVCSISGAIRHFRPPCDLAVLTEPSGIARGPGTGAFVLKAPTNALLVLRYSSPGSRRHSFARQADRWFIAFDRSLSTCCAGRDGACSLVRGIVEGLAGRGHGRRGIEIMPFDCRPGRSVEWKPDSAMKPGDVLAPFTRTSSLGATDLCAVLSRIGLAAEAAGRGTRFLLVTDGEATMGAPPDRAVERFGETWPPDLRLDVVVPGPFECTDVVERIARVGHGRVVRSVLAGGARDGLDRVVSAIVQPLGPELIIPSLSARIRDARPGLEIMLPVPMDFAGRWGRDTGGSGLLQLLIGGHPVDCPLTILETAGAIPARQRTSPYWVVPGRTWSSIPSPDSRPVVTAERSGTSGEHRAASIERRRFIAVLSEDLARRPRDPASREALCKLLLSEGDYERLVAESATWFRMDRRRPEAYELYAKACIALGRTGDAERALSSLAELAWSRQGGPDERLVRRSVRLALGMGSSELAGRLWAFGFRNGPSIRKPFGFRLRPGRTGLSQRRGACCRRGASGRRRAP